MLEAIILYGRNTLICDLPHDPLELQNKLNSTIAMTTPGWKASSPP